MWHRLVQDRVITVEDSGMTLATSCDACGRSIHRDVVALRFATLSVVPAPGGGAQSKALPGAQQAYLVCMSCASYVQACIARLEGDASPSRSSSGGTVGVSFAACDLCYTGLGTRVTEAQVSPARMVQLTGEGKVAHRSTGLRSLRLCVPCGDYLISGFARLRSAYGHGAPARQRMVS